MDHLNGFKYAAAYHAEIAGAEGSAAAEAIWAAANERYLRLTDENSALPEKVKQHTDKLIFPAIAVYKALLEADPANAMRIMETAEDSVSLKTGSSYARLLRPAFMRGIFLRIFSYGAKKGFSEDSGFVNRSINDARDDIAFRIEKCPYHDQCVRYGCPELTHIFCHNDINAYGNLPGIVFERHETLGSGGNCCDFHLYISRR